MIDELLDINDEVHNKAVITAYEAKLKPMTGEEFRARLLKAEDDFKNGRVISTEDLEKESGRILAGNEREKIIQE